MYNKSVLLLISKESVDATTSLIGLSAMHELLSLIYIYIYIFIIILLLFFCSPLVLICLHRKFRSTIYLSKCCVWCFVYALCLYRNCSHCGPYDDNVSLDCLRPSRPLTPKLWFHFAFWFGLQCASTALLLPFEEDCVCWSLVCNCCLWVSPWQLCVSIVLFVLMWSMAWWGRYHKKQHWTPIFGDEIYCCLHPEAFVSNSVPILARHWAPEAFSNAFQTFFQT